MSAKTVWQFAIGSVVLLLIVHAVTVQAARRDIARDTRTSSAIVSLADSVGAMYESDILLPNTLDDIVVDSEEKQRIEEAELRYNKLNSTSFEICAEFNRKSLGRSFDYSVVSAFTAVEFDETTFDTRYGVDTTIHDAGEECFTYNAATRSSVNEFNGFKQFNPSDVPEFSEGDLQNLEELFSDPSEFEEIEAQLQ